MKATSKKPTKRAALEAVVNKPYALVLTPDGEQGGFTAEIKEFPGCVAEGDTADDAVANVWSVAETWVEAALTQGLTIPEPMAVEACSGRVPLRLPPSVHARVKEQARVEGCSLNTYLVSVISAAAYGQELCGKALAALERAASRDPI